MAIAQSIARPLLEELARQPFVGRVLGQFERACNLADLEGRVIALTLPEVGNGPFSIVVAGAPGLFSLLVVGQLAMADRQSLTIGNWRVGLSAAKIWEPKLACPAQPLNLSSAVAQIINSYADWPPLTENLSALSHQRLTQAAAQLHQALIDANTGQRDERFAVALGQLVGLGGGLTPAGDDYLLGVMAALWLAGQHALLPELAKVAAPRTTTLSAAFLRAAAQGEFIEPWHILAQALGAGKAEAVSQAIECVAQFGASSGRDALAGFATTLLSYAGD